MQRRSKTSEEGWLLSYADLITNLLLFFVMLLSAASVSKMKLQQIAKAVSGAEMPQSLESIQRQIEESIKKEGLQNMVRTRLGDDGLELSLNSGVVFDSGSATVSATWEGVLQRMLRSLVPYTKKYSFAVEGHTDAQPIARGNGRFATNWELSGARAIEVRQRLEQLGIDRHKIRVEAYADTKALPASEVAALSLEENMARHRRVVVRIY